jgi:hypothetical protein
MHHRCQFEEFGGFPAEANLSLDYQLNLRPPFAVTKGETSRGIIPFTPDLSATRREGRKNVNLLESQNFVTQSVTFLMIFL